MNSLNDLINKLSGNLFPITSSSPFSIGWKIYNVCAWFIFVCAKIMEFYGFILASKDTLLSDGMMIILHNLEVSLLIIQLHARKSCIARFVRTMNDILRFQDEIMKRIATKNIKLMRFPSKLFCILGMGSLVVWHLVQIVLVARKKSSFYYKNFTPVVFSPQPMSLTNYLLGSIFMLICIILTVGKKIGADMYTMHLIILMTTQYQYFAVKLEELFQKKKSRDSYAITEEGHWQKSDTDQWLEKEMRALCQHHTTIIQ